MKLKCRTSGEVSYEADVNLVQQDQTTTVAKITKLTFRDLFVLALRSLFYKYSKSDEYVSFLT